MKKACSRVILPLLGIVVLSSLTKAEPLQEPKPAEKSATAYRTSERDERKNNSAGTNAAGVTGQPDISSSVSPKSSDDSENSVKRGTTPTTEAQRLYDSGVSFYEAGKFEQAIGAFKQASQLRPADPQTHYILGLAYSQSKSYVDAVESFKRAVRFKPDWPEANFRMGMMSYVLGRRTQSVEAYKSLLKLNSPLANTLYRIINEENPTTAVATNVSLSNDLPKSAEIIPVSNSIQETSTQSKSLPSATNETGSAKTEGNGGPVTKSQSEGAPISEAAGGTSDSTASTPAPTSDQPLTNLYRVGVGDILDIRFINSIAPRSTLFTVIDGGIIDLPVAGGPVSVAGMTAEEIQNRIAAELKRRAVEVNALVAVGVRQYSSHAVIVTGLVLNPGTRFLRREAVPLYVIMAEAQPRLDAGRITILRTGGKAQTVDVSDSSALNTLISAGDVINVGPRPQEYYYIGGRVNYPGQKIFQAGITLLQAILAAGGPAPNVNTIELSREAADDRLTTTRYILKDIKSGKMQDPKLQPGDRIEVVH